jgi:hypothetical protein
MNGTVETRILSGLRECVAPRYPRAWITHAPPIAARTLAAAARSRYTEVGTAMMTYVEINERIDRKKAIVMTAEEIRLSQRDVLQARPPSIRRPRWVCRVPSGRSARGYAVDLIGPRGNPMENLGTLADVSWIMRDGEIVEDRG